MRARAQDTIMIIYDKCRNTNFYGRLWHERGETQPREQQRNFDCLITDAGVCPGKNTMGDGDINPEMSPHHQNKNIKYFILSS